jgi:hypothetical protein
MDANELYLRALNTGVQVLEGSVEFAGRELPLLAQEYILYTTIWSGSSFILVVILLVTEFYIFYKNISKLDFDKDPELKPIAFIMVSVISLILSSIFLCEGSDFLKGMVAPRVLLVEKAAELAKSLK